MTHSKGLAVVEETTPLLAGDTRSYSTENEGTVSSVTEEEALIDESLSPKHSVLGMLAVLLIGVFIANADTSLVLATYGEISSEFNSLDNASWLLTSYMLAMCSTQAIYGKMSNIYGRKPVLLTAYALSAVGCLICGIENSMTQVIIGRVIGGAGGAGMYSVVSFLIADLVPQREIAAYRSYVNIVQTVGRSCGGPIGGYLADSIGWRWSFLIQCPLTVLAIILVSWLLKVPSQHKNGEVEVPFRQKIARIDFYGAILMCIGIVTFLLPLSMGGVQYAWKDPIIPTLFGISLVFFMGFAKVEMDVAKEPIFPLYLLKNRDVILSYLLLTLQNISQTLMMYVVPLYFQVTKSASPAAAGFYLVPAVVGNTVGGLLSGGFIKRTGRYKLPVLLSTIISGIGHCLTTIRWTGNTSVAEALYIFPGGVGTGISHSSTFIALTAGVTEEELAMAGSGLYLCGNIGSLLGVTIASSLVRGVARISATRKLEYLGEEGLKIIEKSLSDVNFIKKLRASVHELIVAAYVDGFRVCFGGAILCCCIGLVLGLMLQEKRLN